VSDAVLDGLAANAVVWTAQPGNGTITIPPLSPNGVTRAPVIGDPLPQTVQALPPANDTAPVVVLGVAAGWWARAAGFLDRQKRRPGWLRASRKSS